MAEKDGKGSCRNCRCARGTIKQICTRSALVAAGIAALASVLLLIISLVVGGIPYIGWYFVGIVALSLIAGFFVGVRSSKQITTPVSQLAEQADRFAGGQFDTVFHIDEGPRELCALSDSLNTITRTTRSALGELKTEEQRQRQFVSDVSHEIRTPLTGIRGNAETLLDPDMPPELRARFCDIIIEECDRLTRLANDLLELQRIEESDIALARVNLRDVADNVCDMLAPLFEDRGIDVIVTGEAPDVLGEADRLTQVLVNLLENATRFAESTVKVELSGMKDQSVVTVSDDGPGFGDTDPSRLFDRFYRGDKSRASATGGTGLGLAIVKSIVEAHDGTVEAFNLPDKGACFAIGIPSIVTR